MAWRRLLIEAWLACAAFATAIQARSGPSLLAHPLNDSQDYLAALPQIRSLLDFYRTYGDNVLQYPVHIQSHPPGFITLAWLLKHIGLGSPYVMATICILVGASAVPAALLAASEVASQKLARRAAPFLVFGPIVLFIATTADALYSGLFAWGAYLVIRSIRTGVRSALGGGVALGLALYCSYGVAPLLLLPGVYVVHRRAWKSAVVASVGALAVAAIFTELGFNWFVGLDATRRAYKLSVPGRPYYFFVFNNLAAFAIAIGPAAIVALRRLRDRRLWLLVGAAAAALLLADVSGLSKAEVERIWLPFAPWLLLATAAIPDGLARRWLAVQAAAAIVLQLCLITPW